MNLSYAIGDRGLKKDAAIIYSYFVVGALALMSANAWNDAAHRFFQPHDKWRALLYATCLTLASVVVVIVMHKVLRHDVRHWTRMPDVKDIST